MATPPSSLPLRGRFRTKSPKASSGPQIDLEALDSPWPPQEDTTNETEAARAERLAKEQEAKRVNDEIDRQLEIERNERRKRKIDVKILLLGAWSRCGKAGGISSCLLK